MSKDIVPVGRISKPIGLKGKFKVLLISRGSLSLEDAGELFIGDSEDFSPFEVEEVSLKADCAVIKVRGIDSQEDVLKYKNSQVGVDARMLPEKEENEYYHRELIGSSVYTEEGILLGKLNDIIETGSNDVFLIKKGKKEHLIPAIDSVIKKIDKEKKTIVIEVSQILIDD